MSGINLYAAEKSDIEEFVKSEFEKCSKIESVLTATENFINEIGEKTTYKEVIEKIENEISDEGVKANLMDKISRSESVQAFVEATHKDISETREDLSKIHSGLDRITEMIEK